MRIWWWWHAARIISLQKIYGLYGLKPHIVEISGDVTDPDGRTNERTTRKYRATQLLIWEPMSFAIIFMLTGTTRSFATWSLNIWSTRTAETTWLADLDVLLKSMWLYTVCVKLSNAKSFNKLIFSNLFICYFSQGQRDYHRGLIGERRRLWVLGGIVRWQTQRISWILKDEKLHRPHKL